MKISTCSKSWINFVDTTTVTWLLLFIVGFIALDTNLLCLKEQAMWGRILEELTEPFCINTSFFLLPQVLEKPIYVINWIIWIIFVLDLILKYIELKNYRVFFKKHWFDIILLIPFFRILSLLRFLRLCVRMYNEYKISKK